MIAANPIPSAVVGTGESSPSPAVAAVLLDLHRAGLGLHARRERWIYYTTPDGREGGRLDERSHALTMQPLEIALRPENAALVERARTLKPLLTEWIYSAEHRRRVDAITLARGPGSAWTTLDPHADPSVQPRPCATCSRGSWFVAPDGIARHPWCGPPAGARDPLDGVL